MKEKNFKRLKNIIVIENEYFIIFKNCKPRPIFRDRIHEEAFFLRKNRKTKKLEPMYTGY